MLREIDRELTVCWRGVGLGRLACECGEGWAVPRLTGWWGRCLGGDGVWGGKRVAAGCWV